MLVIKPLTEYLKNPTKAYTGDAAWDLYSLEDCTLWTQERRTFRLGFAIIGQPGKVYITAGKSGLALKYGIHTIGNIIDNQYRGEITVTLVNTGGTQFIVHRGDKIAQLLVQNVDDDNILQIYDKEIEKTDRGENGHGSSGI